MNQKAVIEDERFFVENFLAMAYFRVPMFRRVLIAKLGEEDRGTIVEEWRGTDYSIDREEIEPDIPHHHNIFL